MKSSIAGRRRLRQLAGWTLTGALLLTPGCHHRRKPENAAPVGTVYQEALAKMKKQRYYSARTLLQSLQTRIPQDDRELLPLVQLKLADAFYLDGGILNLAEALGAYRNFLTYYPQREEAAYAQFMVGMSYFGQVLAPDRDQALTYQAIEEFGKVERLYPGSPYVERAAEQILACRELLAAHEFVIGGYYYQKKSFLAAADRYRVILDRYPHFARTEETLFLLADCLTATANPDEARLYYERLVKEFPDGKYSRAARSRLQGTGNG